MMFDFENYCTIFKNTISYLRVFKVYRLPKYKGIIGNTLSFPQYLIFKFFSRFEII